MILKFNGKVLTLSHKPAKSEPLSEMGIPMDNFVMDFEHHDMKEVATKFIYHLTNSKDFNFKVENGKTIAIENGDSLFANTKMIAFKITEKSSSSIWDCICGCEVDRSSSSSKHSVQLDEHKDLLIEEFRKFL